jgi:hypothetical protein
MSKPTYEIGNFPEEVKYYADLILKDLNDLSPNKRKEAIKWIGKRSKEIVKKGRSTFQFGFRIRYKPGHIYYKGRIIPKKWIEQGLSEDKRYVNHRANVRDMLKYQNEQIKESTKSTEDKITEEILEMVALVKPFIEAERGGKGLTKSELEELKKTAEKVHNSRRKK